MSIQISLVIWTAIGFGVLAFILNKFLFKPLLQVMAARNSKIEADRSMKRAELEERERVRIAAEQERLAAQERALKSGEEELEKAKAETETILLQKKEEYEAVIEQKRMELAAEAEQIRAGLSDEIDELALAYVTTVIL